MAATVRLHTYSGMVASAVASYSSQATGNAVWLLRNPYIANETLTATTASAVASTDGQFNDGNTKLVKVEVQNGKRVRIEFTPANHDLRSATTDSPVVYGEEVFAIGPGWRISVLEDS